MEGLTRLLSWPSIAAATVLCYATRVLYWLYLHPLARFPGPKLAAAMRLYKGYYDLYQKGQYTFKLAQLRKQYSEQAPAYQPAFRSIY